MTEKTRTLKQNRSLHKLFEILATELNEAGLDMKKTLKPHVEIPWSKETVKEFLWRPIMEHQLRKKSTAEMTTKDIDFVFETISRHLADIFGLAIDFPSIESESLQKLTERKE